MQHGTDMPRAADYIVVGSGSGGAAVARRLWEAGAGVLVVEAGRDPVAAPEISDPSCWFGLQGSDWDWGHRYASGPAVLYRDIPIPRGLALGGSSATNAMMWYRGTPADYARWDAVAPGWSWADCLPAFRTSEAWEGGADDLRGGDGPLVITRSNAGHPLTRAMLGGGAAMGLPVVADPNGPEPLGVSLGNFNIRDGRRWSSADGYLRPAMSDPRLQVLTGVRAVEILFEGLRAAGLRLADGEVITARQGVVLAAGALETPRLLMLSGIGPEAELARLGLSCRLKAEGVGQNLQDHPLLRALNFRARRPLGAMQGNGGGTLTIWKSDPALPEADLLAFPIQGRSAVPALYDHYDLDGDLFAIGLGRMRAQSRGFLRLTGAAPDAPLHVQPNLLGDPRDLAALVEGVLFLQEVVQTLPFAELFAGFAAPEKPLDRSEAELFVRRSVSTFFHCTGTAAMGSDDDAPVTPDLRIRGTDGLWVADASVIPEIPCCHTHAPVTMIGERAAAFILETR